MHAPENQSGEILPSPQQIGMRLSPEAMQTLLSQQMANNTFAGRVLEQAPHSTEETRAYDEAA
jgi:hypothetical protein